MMKPLAICFVAGLAMSLGSASARDLHGTTNSTIGSKDASTGTNGMEHSTANRALRGTGGSERSVNGTANSTIGSRAVQQTEQTVRLIPRPTGH